MKKIYQAVFNFFTRLFSYGIAVTAFSILWSGLFTELNLTYLVPLMSRFFDFSPEWYLLLKILFVLPFPTAFVLYGFFTKIGIPAALPTFRFVNRNICVEKGELKIRDGMTEDEYIALLRGINRIPVLFFIVATIEVAYIDVIVLAVAIYKGFSLSTIAWIFFSWGMQTVNYAGVGFIFAEAATGNMRMACKKKLRELNIPHEIPTKSSFISKLVLITLLILITLCVSVAMTYLQRGEFGRVLAYITTYSSVIAMVSYLTIRTFYRALNDTGRVIESLKERGEGIIYSPSFDREIVEIAAGVNAASDTITDYRQNLELKVNERTEELQAAMSELEAVNDNLTQVNRELEDSNVRYRKDMKMAGNVQNAFLPKKPPASAEFDMAFVFRPASEVSGDFYDFYVDNGMLTGAGIFDVSGHGISSGLLTLLARSIIYRNFSSMKNQKLGAIMNSINRDLIDEIGHSGMYLTGILLRFAEGMVEYANSGHPDMIFRSSKDGRTGRVVTPEGNIVGPFLGVDILEKEFKSIKIRLNPGDCLLLYTDSLVESKNTEREQYDEKRLIASLKDAPGGSAREMLDYVIEQFFSFMGKENPLKDDITAVLIRKK